MEYRIIELEIIRWAEARKIIPNSTPVAQYLKAVSEMGELADALNKKDMAATKDAVGDAMSECKHCRDFFALYRCAKDTHGECDCPKCQGYCECAEELKEDKKDDCITRMD